MERKRKWQVTLNNWVPIDLDQWAWAAEQAKYVIGCFEVGEQGTPHMHAFVVLKNAVTMKGLKRLWGDKCHVEACKGSDEQNINYIKKDGSWWQAGVKPVGQGHRTDLDRAGMEIVGGMSSEAVAYEDPGTYIKYHHGLKQLELVTQKPPKWRDVVVEVYWGATGTGKTRKAMEENESIYKMNTSTNGHLWFDGYTNEEVLLLDDYYGWIKFGDLLTILDGYPYRCEIKGGFAWAKWTKVIITSNKKPEEWYQYADISPLRRRINSELFFEFSTEVSTEVGGNTGPRPPEVV